MKTFIRSAGLVFFALFAGILQGNENAFEGWTHLELGAANYGQRKHNREWSLKKSSHLTDMDFYIAQLDYDNWGQYGVLYWTLDELVERYGEKGVFHVNDCREQLSNYTARMLKKYAAKKGYSEVIIEPITADFFQIDPVQTLIKFGRERYDSVHLKNPEPSLYRKTAPAERAKTRRLFQKLADLSYDGFFLFYYRFDSYTPKAEIEEYINKGIFYQETDEWEPVPYVSTNGHVTSQSLGKVVFIQSTPQDSDADQE